MAFRLPSGTIVLPPTVTRTLTAATSLNWPAAIAVQNRRRSSRSPTPGRSGDHSAARPARSEFRFRLPIANILPGVATTG